MGRKNRKKRKILLLFIVILITSVVLVVETYAWFVGLSTVNTNSFNKSISSGSELEISMDGEHWQSLCSERDNNFICTDSGLTYEIKKSGTVKVSSGSSWNCTVDTSGFSKCT